MPTHLTGGVPLERDIHDGATRTRVVLRNVRTAEDLALLKAMTGREQEFVRAHAANLVFTPHSPFSAKMDDTTDAALVRDAVLRHTPIERLRTTLALSESMPAVALAGLRERYPDCTVLELVELITGETLRVAVRHGPCRDGSVVCPWNGTFTTVPREPAFAPRALFHDAGSRDVTHAWCWGT